MPRNPAWTNEQHAVYRAANRERVRHNQNSYSQRYRARTLEFLGGVCTHCGFADSRALQVDHVNGGGSGSRTSPHRRSQRVLLNEVLAHPEEHQLLCANCNWIKRHENKEWN